MVRRVRRALLAALAVAGLVACGEDSNDDPPMAAAVEPAAAEPPRARRGPLVKLRNSEYGRVLFSGKDQAVYLFTKDDPRRSRCYGACAEAWPPFYAKGGPRAGRGVKQSLLGTTKRRDGRRQITYRGHPLYFYDEPPRQILCQNVVEFGGTWLVVNPKGQAVR